MSNYIHPTAIVHSKAQLGSGNYIGPYCLIEENVLIGNDNRFEAFVSIGTPPEDKSYWPQCPRGVRIGNRNVFREYVTVNCGTARPTDVGDDNSFLKGSHVGHDCLIDANCVFSCGVLIGGHTTVERNCNFGLGSVVHQMQYIGAFSMIGMNATIPKGLKVSPGFVWVGSPAKILKPNLVGLGRAHISDKVIAAIRREFENSRAR